MASKKKKEYQIFALAYSSTSDTVSSEYYDTVHTLKEAKEAIGGDDNEAVVYEVDRKKNRHRQVMSNWGGFSVDIGKWEKGLPTAEEM